MAETLKHLTECLEQYAPPSLQESWDNSGLILGDPHQLIGSAVVTIDVTEAVVDDAIAHGDNLIIAHHPLIFSGIKRLNGKTDSERAIIKAIRHNIAIYSAHTNLDVVRNGVSWRMAEKLELNNLRTLAPQKGLMKKLVTFIPVSHIEALQNAVFEAGAGHIGNYDSCSFQQKGNGTFRGGENTNPFVGKKGTLHTEEEIRFETIIEAPNQGRILAAMLKAHPYEEVAYDIYPLENTHPNIGLGVIGETQRPEELAVFLNRVKHTFGCEVIRYAGHCNPVKIVALCGGSGSSLINDAQRNGADVFITGDIKYHQFFDLGSHMVLADIGHYESEQFTKELFYEIVTKNFSKFALRLSEVQTNPVKYLF